MQWELLGDGNDKLYVCIGISRYGHVLLGQRWLPLQTDFITEGLCLCAWLILGSARRSWSQLRVRPAILAVAVTCSSKCGDLAQMTRTDK